MSRKANKTDIISFRVEKKVKEKLEEMADEKRRELSDYMRLIASDIAEGKIKVTI
jgi:antitoxin component of RelBE/YafQ-DinJ toxin-antitoxin module